MKKILVALVTVLLTLTACDPTNPPPESATGGGWNGTKYTRCDIPNKPPPGKVFGPRAGFVHILVVITADRFEDSDRNKVCEANASIPFSIRLNGKLDKIPAIKPDRGQPLPWTANLRTPHFEHLYVPLTGKAKIWEVTVHATITIKQHWIRCAIFVDNTRAARHSERLQAGRAIATASCAASGPVS